MEHLYHDDVHDWGFITGHDRVHNAIVLLEGFDHYTAAQAASKGWTVPSAMVTGRFGGQAFESNTTTLKGKALPASYTTLFGGFAFKTSVINNGPQDICTLLVGGVAGTLTFRMGYDAASKISIRNSGGTVVATGTTVLAPNVWYYIEFKAVINGASGSCEIHLNGVSEIATTTGNFGSTGVDFIAFRGQGALNDYDDVYCADSTGSAPRNTFLGDVRVATLTPTSDGNYTQWTPLSGSHFSNVDDATPNDDTDYVSDSTPGHLDTYGFSDVDSGATVYGVQTNLYARKDDANVRQIAPVIRQSATDYVGTTVTLSSTYLFYSQLYNQDPTAADWTAANVNSDEFGVKEIA